MRVSPTSIDGVLLLEATRHGDERGYFMETYRRSALAEAGVDADLVQDNESLSPTAGTLRGLHFQLPPRAQGKLVRAVRGSFLDVAVDLRRNSSSFGRHISVRVSAKEANQLWVPAGFAHGVCTLEPDTIVAYKVTEYWSPEHERTLRFDDPALGIEWPSFEIIANERDRAAPLLAELTDLF
jgi:dTDP-4-dehydrorhamnose 3,5-epimerase